MVELWTRKGEMGDEDRTNMEDASGYVTSGVWLAWMRWQDLISVSLPAGLGLVRALSGMVNWLTHEILLSPSLSWWLSLSSLISLFLCWTLPSSNNMKLSHPTLSLHAMLMRLHWVQHTPIIASSKDRRSPAHSQFHLLVDIVALNSQHSHN